VPLTWDDGIVEDHIGPGARSTSEVNVTGWSRGLEVTADGEGVVSHAGLAPLRLLADRSGLTAGLSGALASSLLLLHDRGRVLTDLSCAIADGARVISDFRTMTDQQELFGPVASVPTVWRTLDEIAEGGKPAQDRITAAVDTARRWAWTRIEARHGAIPGIRIADKTLEGVVGIRLDATVTPAHSDKEGAQPNFKGFGHHPLLSYCDNLNEPLAGMMRPGSAGSNTTSAAPRGASSYPQLSWEELGGRFLGLMANPDPKGDGDSSMPEKQRSCSGVRSEALRDPRDTAKAILPEPQSPGDARCHPPERRLEPAPCPMPAYQWGRHSLRGADDAQ